MAEMEKTYYCEKCHGTFKGKEFYTSNNLEKYPDDGKLPQCKKCITLHIDNWDPDTYMWILQEADVPYVPDEWNKLLASYAQDPSKVTGTTIIGRYLSKMKLVQYKKYRWKDTAFLQELANKKIEEAMKRQGYDAQEITRVIEKASFDVPERPIEKPVYEADNLSASGYVTSGRDYFDSDDDNSFVMDLTEEDRVYLRLKWGKAYKPEEWIKLEQLYNEMMESYDIQSAGHIDTLKLVCKTSLKANQLLDIGDVDGAQKMVKMYDGLMKSGKFTAAQNKAEKGEYVDSVSELVALCETDGFIPRYYTDGPQDKVDRTLQDLQSYTRTLVMEEMNLGTLIENAVKQIEIDKLKEAERDADAASDEDLLEAELFENTETYNTDQDYEQFRDLEEEFEANDDELLRKLLDGEI